MGNANIMGVLSKDFLFEVISVAKWPAIFILADKFILRKIKIPKDVQEKHVAEYQNELVSLVHAVVVGTAATVTLSAVQGDDEKVINLVSPVGRELVKFSFGYFAYDLRECLKGIFGYGKLTAFLTVHHIGSMAGLGLTLYSKKICRHRFDLYANGSQLNFCC